MSDSALLDQPTRRRRTTRHTPRRTPHAAATAPAHTPLAEVVAATNAGVIDSPVLGAARVGRASTKPLLIADLFCGAGGFSTAARKVLQARGKSWVLTCVNHWPVAIASHAANHPEARHVCADLEGARPEELVPEGYLDLLLASPTCTFHSRARGGRPTSDQQRMDPFTVLRWMATLRVKVAICENVPEFIDWGPVNAKTGRPLKSRRGEYFRAWVNAMRAMGFVVEWRVLNSANFGAATARSRLFIVARSDAKPIRWPEPTHTKEGGTDLFGTTERWRGAREIIDWQDKGESIFGRPAPLKPNTLRRVAAGNGRFSGPAAPIIAAALEEESARSAAYWALPKATRAALRAACRAVEKGTRTLADYAGDPVASAYLTQLYAPAPLVLPATPGGAAPGAASEAASAPFIVPQHRTGVARAVDAPLGTITTRAKLSLVTPVDAAPFLTMFYGTGAARPVGSPLPTVTAQGSHVGLAVPSAVRAADDAAFLTTYYGSGGTRTERVRSVDAPLATVTTNPRFGLARPSLEAEPTPAPAPFLTAYYGSNVEQACGVASVDAPLGTVTTKARFGLCAPFLVSVNHGDGPSGNNHRRVRSVDLPLQALTTNPSFALCASDVQAPERTPEDAGVAGADAPRGTPVAAFLVPQFGERPGQQPRTHTVDAPLPAVTSHGAGALVQPTVDPTGVADVTAVTSETPAAFLVSRFGERAGGPRVQDVTRPLPAVVTRGAGYLAAPTVALDDAGWITTTGRQQRVERGTGRVRQRGRLVEVGGQLLRVDIRFRMLRNGELARAMSFSDEESEYEFCGTTQDVTKQIGNAVEVRTAAALIAAQFPA